MRILSFSLESTVTCLLLAICLALGPPSASAQEPAPAAGQASAAVPALSRLQAEQEKVVQDKAEAPLQAGLKQLNDAYRAALNGLLKKASGAGSLDQAVAAKQELASFSTNETVPATDDPALDPEVAKLRKAWRAEDFRLQKQHNLTLQQLSGPYLERLRLLEIDFTRALKLDEAKAVREQRDLATKKATALAELLAAPATPAVTLPPAVAAASTPTPPKPPAFSAMTRPAERQDLYASGSNGCLIHVNGKEIGTVMRDKPSKFRLGLREGDVIAVKNQDRFDINSFWLSCLSNTGEFLFESGEQWTSYCPASLEKWWVVKSPKEQKPAAPAPDKQEYVNLVKASAATTPLSHGAQPIRSVVDTGSRAAYLYYVVTKADLMPKAPPAAAK